MSTLEIEFRNQSNEPKTPTKSNHLNHRKLVPQSPIPLFISPKKQAQLSFASLPCLVEEIVLAALLHSDPECFFRSIPLVCRGWLRAYQSPMLYCAGIDMRWLGSLEGQQQEHQQKLLQHQAGQAVAQQSPLQSGSVSSLSLRSPTENLLHTLKRRDRLRLLRTVILPAGLPFRTVDKALSLLGKHCEALQRVDLNGSCASDAGVRALVEGCGSTLTHLNLATRKPGLTNFALFALASHATNLRALDASAMVGINAAGVRWLIDGLGGRALRELRLSHCPYVGGSVAGVLASGAPNLSVLRMEGITLTAHQFRQLVWQKAPQSTPSARGGSAAAGQLSPLLASGSLQCLALDGHDTVDQNDIAALLEASPRLEHLSMGKGLSLNEHCLVLLSGTVVEDCCPEAAGDAENQSANRSTGSLATQSKPTLPCGGGDCGTASTRGGCCPRLQCLSFRPATEISSSCLRARVQQVADSCELLQSITVRHQGGGRRSVTFFPSTAARPNAKVRLPECNQQAFPINCTH